MPIVLATDQRFNMLVLGGEYRVKHVPIIWGWLELGVDFGIKTLLEVLSLSLSASLTHGRKKQIN